MSRLSRRYGKITFKWSVAEGSSLNSNFPPLSYSDKSLLHSDKSLSKSDGFMRDEVSMVSPTSSNNNLTSHTNNLSSSSGIKKNGQYEIFIPLLSFNPSQHEKHLQQLTFEEIVQLYRKDNNFKYFMRFQNRLDYLSERFRLEYTSTFEALVQSYEFRRCLPSGSIGKYDSLKWSVVDNDTLLLKEEHTKLLENSNKLPDYQLLCCVHIENHDDLTILEWLLEQAFDRSCYVDHHKLIETCIIHNRLKAFEFILSIYEFNEKRVEYERLLKVALEWNKKEMCRYIKTKMIRSL